MEILTAGLEFASGAERVSTGTRANPAQMNPAPTNIRTVVFLGSFIANIALFDPINSERQRGADAISGALKRGGGRVHDELRPRKVSERAEQARIPAFKCNVELIAPERRFAVLLRLNARKGQMPKRRDLDLTISRDRFEIRESQHNLFTRWIEQMALTELILGPSRHLFEREAMP
jgi:hypothetical protein